MRRDSGTKRHSPSLDAEGSATARWVFALLLCAESDTDIAFFLLPFAMPFPDELLANGGTRMVSVAGSCWLGSPKDLPSWDVVA